jgi:uncharacterized membrane protein
LDGGNSGVGENDNESKPIYEPLLVIVGFVLVLSGLILSKKVFWKIDDYFVRQPSIAIPLALIILSVILMWLGIGIAAYGFGAFGHFQANFLAIGITRAHGDTEGF